MYGSSSQSSFADLMSMAKQNADKAKKKTNMSLYGPDGSQRRSDPKQVKLKQGVAQFLAKREEEERKRAREKRVKLDKLLELRNQDRKAANRVRKMLSMTKSANKSCMDEANDCLNASVSAQGEIQPDEDDYGYTSNYADMMHKKMMEKYKSIPIKPAFPESRVPVPKSQSLQKSGPSSRRTHSEYKGDTSPVEDFDIPEPAVPSKKPEKPSKVPKKQPPPPPDYQQLLQLAQQKQFEPVLPTKSVIDKNAERDEFEFGRPMTAKEKAAYLSEKALKDRVARRQQGGVSDKNNNSSDNKSQEKGSVSFKIPNKSKSREEEISPPKRAKVSEPELDRPMRETPKPAPSESSSRFSASAPKSSSVSNNPNGYRSSPPNGSTSKLMDRLTKPNDSSPNHSSYSRDTPKSNMLPKVDHRGVSNHAGQDQRKPSTSSDTGRDQNRKPANLREQSVKAQSSRGEILQGRGTDNRANSRNGLMASMTERERELDRRPPKRDMPLPSRRDVAHSPARRDMAHSPARRDMAHSPARRDMAHSPARRDVGPPPARRDVGPPPRRREEGPPPGRREAGPPPGRREAGPPPGRREAGPPPGRRDAAPPPGRRDMAPPSARRDMAPPPGRRDMAPPQARRDMTPPPARRDVSPPPRRGPPQSSRRDVPEAQRRGMVERQPVRRREESPMMRPKMHKGRAIIDSDEEYDSEMDDFIDDSEVDTSFVSSEISKIFNYDRHRYRYNDESDDECMESSVAQQMREEQRSLRIGIQEDLEDIQREEEEKRRMKMKKKGGR